jgi:hypothetical protein
MSKEQRYNVTVTVVLPVVGRSGPQAAERGMEAVRRALRDRGIAWDVMRTEGKADLDDALLRLHGEDEPGASTWEERIRRSAGP